MQIQIQKQIDNKIRIEVVNSSWDRIFNINLTKYDIYNTLKSEVEHGTQLPNIVI